MTVSEIDALRSKLPKPETMLTYASILEKPQYWIDPKTNQKYLLATGEIVEAACAALRLTAALLDQVVVPSGWQPIDSVPKHNRVYVDLWFPQRDIGEYGRIPDCQYLANETTPGWYAWSEEADAFYYIGDGATYWMFRPKSPAPASTAGEVKSG